MTRPSPKRVQMIRQMREPCKAAGLHAVALFCRVMLQIWEKVIDFAADVALQRRQSEVPRKEAFRRRAIGKDDLVILEHDVEIAHLATAVHHTGSATLQPGKMDRPNKGLFAIDIEHHTVLW